MAFLEKRLRLPAPEEALPGREAKMPVAPRHAVLGNPMLPPYPDELELACFGLGCFWGAERKFWQAPQYKPKSSPIAFRVLAFPPKAPSASRW